MWCRKLSLNHSVADHTYKSEKKPRPVRSAKPIPIQTSYLLNLKLKKKKKKGKEDTATNPGWCERRNSWETRLRDWNK